jgi:hypothetical protein
MAQRSLRPESPRSREATAQRNQRSEKPRPTETWAMQTTNRVGVRCLCVALAGKTGHLPVTVPPLKTDD